MKTNFHCKACGYEFKSDRGKIVHGDKPPIELGTIENRENMFVRAPFVTVTNLLACPICHTVKIKIEN